MSASGLNRTEKKAAATLASVFALRMLGLFLIMPVLAVMGQSYPDYTPFLVGVAIGAYGLTQALLQIPLGRLSDRLGRKPIILGGLAIFTVGSVVAAMSDTLTGVVVGRVLQGAGAIAGAVLALAADSSREEQRPKVMAAIGMGIGLSFVVALMVAPVLGGIIGISGLFWVTAGLTVGGILLVQFALPETHQRVPSRDILPVPAELKRLFKDGQLARLNTGIFILHLVLTAWFVTLPLALVDAGLAAEKHSWLYLPTLLLSFAVMVPFMIVMVRRNQQVRGMQIAALLLVISLSAITYFSSSIWWLAVAVWVFFIGFNYLEASFPAMLTQYAPAGSKGSASGLYATFQFGGAFVGGVSGGFLFQQAGVFGVMIFCIALLVCWLVFSFGLQRISPSARLSFPLPGLTQDNAGELASQLTAQRGVKEAIVLSEERATYLKIDRDEYDAEAVTEILRPYR